MTVNQVVKNALSKLDCPVVLSVYTGKKDCYITFNPVSEKGRMYADNEPQAEESAVQVHLWSGAAFDYTALKEKIKKNLFDAGFSYPDVTILYDQESGKNHVVFECEYTMNLGGK